MKKRLVKYGNSSALIFDKTILALLGLNEGEMLELRIEGNTLIVKKSQEFSADEEKQANLLSELEQDPEEQKEMMKKLRIKMMENVFNSVENTMDKETFELYKKDYQELIVDHQPTDFYEHYQNTEYAVEIQRLLKSYSNGEISQKEHEQKSLEASKIVSQEFYQKLKLQKEKLLEFQKKWADIKTCQV